LQLRDSILGYISPLKYRRRTTVSPVAPTSTNKTSTPNRPSRTDKSFTEPKDANTRAVLNGRVSKKYLSPSDTRRRRQISKVARSQSSSNSDGGAESTAPDQASDHTSRTSDGSQTPAKLPQIIESVEVDDNITISLEDKVSWFLEHQRAVLEADNGGGENWHEAEHALFNELKMRGLQPLLPARWRPDFRTVPPALFSYDADETFLNSASGNEFRGMSTSTPHIYQTNKV
jgi:hypothetical protein